MPTIHLTTFIAAPVERVFDLSRSVDMHKKSMAPTNEKAVAGVTSGLIGLNETVTWKARHLMKERVMKMKITSLQRPLSFTDEMLQGDFKNIRHEHYFRQIDNGTLMIDLFSFETPFGFVGKLVNHFYLAHYLQQLLQQRNRAIKECAESNRWQQFLEN